MILTDTKPNIEFATELSQKIIKGVKRCETCMANNYPALCYLVCEMGEKAQVMAVNKYGIKDHLTTADKRCIVLLITRREDYNVSTSTGRNETACEGFVRSGYS